jgi:hypothetical protein
MVHPMDISCKQSRENYREKYDHYEYGVAANSDELLNKYQLRLKTLEEMFEDDQLNPLVYMELARETMDDHIWDFMRHLWLALLWLAFMYYLASINNS